MIVALCGASLEQRKPNDPYEIKNGFTTGKHLLYAFVYDDTRLRCTYELN
jgi:hypothetical protein